MTRTQFLKQLKKQVERELRDEKMWTRTAAGVKSATSISGLIDYFVYDAMGYDNSKDAMAEAVTLVIRMFVKDYTVKEFDQGEVPDEE